MLERLKDLLKQKKSQTFYADKLGITTDEVKELMKELRSETTTTTTGFVNTNPLEYNYGEVTSDQRVNNEKGTLESTVVSSFDPKNDLELADLHKVDLTKYKISSYWTKQRGDKFTSSLLCSLKKPQDYSPEDFSKFLETYQPKFKQTLLGLPLDINKESIDVELSIADFHLAKKTFDNETIHDRKEQFLTIVKDLVSKITSNYNINKIVFPISNDFFHTDNYQNQTTNLTPQDVLVGFNHEYEMGFDILVNSILFLKTQTENVEVILVQGNHDRTKSFYLAHALQVFFKDTSKIKFQREHSTTKSVVLGNTFIGYHHGNCKIEDLPLLFATGKDSQKFGNALYREVHTGDKHHYMAKEIKGVRIQQMPSLSGTDRWHEDHNFVNSIRAGIATCYDKETGRIAEFESRIKPCKH